MAEPRHHTPRSDRATTGPAIGRVQRLLGQTPMPWQQHLYDVVGEIDPATGLPWYRTVILRVQRRSGKTAAIAAVLTHRCLTSSAETWYTAQTGRYASEWMRDDYQRALASSPLARARAYVASRRSGAESVRWPSTGSHTTVWAPTADALHGHSSDIVIVDEAWAHDDQTGRDIRQAVRPTLLTRPGSQMWIVSAGGHAGSTYLHGYCRAGEQALTDPASRTAYIDYGIPDGAPTDVDTIAAHHPAYGITVTRDALEDAAADFAGDTAGWARAYGTVETSAADTAIPAPLWDQAGEQETPPGPPERAGIGWDVAPDGRTWSLAIAWHLDDQVWVELVHHGTPPRDAPQIIADLAGRYSSSTAGCDAVSAGAMAMADHLTPDQCRITRLGPTQVADAVQQVMTRLSSGTLRHGHQAALDAAAAAVGRRTIRDGHMVWGRTASSGDISPIVAATIAVRMLDHLPPPPDPVMLVI